MRTDDLHRSLPRLFSELVYGATGGQNYILNPGDVGLLASLDRLPHEAASASSHGGATIAAHVAHLRYGLSLMNRWFAGENPFGNADWGEAWKTGAVDEDDWTELRRALRAEVEQWHAALQSDRDVRGMELSGVIASVAHLAYHLGAIRQIDAQLRGPKETA